MYIKDFLKVISLPNGKIKISQEGDNLENMYKVLYNLGYRKSKLDGKNFYYKREGFEIIRSNVLEIRNAFYTFLNNIEFAEEHSEYIKSEINNWFISKSPIKENPIFDLYLFETLNEIDIHNFKLRTDPYYRDKVDAEQLVLKLKEWGFHQTKDILNMKGKVANTIYYKNININQYLVFERFGIKHDYDMFDCLIVKHKNSKDIGIKIPLSSETIRLSFKLYNDSQLIEQYIN